MNPRSLSILLLISWVYSWTGTGHLAAQQLEPFYYNYNTDDGLPSSECYEIIQDQQGYIWVSTDNGVSRFNGEEFTNFGTEEGLTDKTILFMHEDHRGWIWMSSLNGNFFIYRNDTIAAFEHNHLLQDIKDEFYVINDFVVDTVGTIYASLQYRGIVKITEDGELQSIDFQELGLNTIAYYLKHDKALVLDRSLKVKKQALNNIREEYRLKLQEQQIARQYLIVDDTLYSKQFRFDYNSYNADGNGMSIYATVVDSSLFHRVYNSLYWYPNYQKGLQQVEVGFANDRQIIYLLRDFKSEGFYAGYFKGAGLSYFSNLQQLLSDQPLYTILEQHTITHLYQGPGGDLWVGTLENGIYYIPAPQTLYLKNTDEFIFSAITKLENHNLLSCSTQGDLLSIKANLEYAPHSRLKLHTGAGFLDQFRLADSTVLLVALNPLQIREKNNWILPLDDDPFRIKSFQPRVQLREIRPSLDGEMLWGIKSSTGLIAIRPPLVGNQFIETVQTIAPNKQITSILEQKNWVWLGTRQGLLKYNKNTQEVTGVSDASIASERIEDIESISDTLIAVATRGSGLFFLGPNSLEIWNNENGLASNTISVLQKDGDILWLGSKNGLHRIVLSQGLSSAYLYTQKDGLASSEVLDIVIDQDFAWVLTKAGLVRISKELASDNYTPAFVLESLRVNGLDKPASQLNNLAWTENSLQLRFQFLDFTQIKNKTYRFRLNDDAEWITRNSSNLDLLNLSPGPYQLQIQSLNRSGKWVGLPPLSFHIHPPFWQTSWFFLLCLSVSLLVLYLLFRQRLRNLTREKERLSLQEQVSQLKQQAYRAQMNPHFIFNCLSTLQGMVVGDSTDQNKAVRMIANFSQLIRYSLEASRRDKVSLQDEIGLIRRYLLLEQLRFNHGFTFDIQVDSKLDPEWTEIPPMLVQPYAENAVLHGMEGKTGDGHIIVQYLQEGERLRVNIQDNGPGIYTTQAFKTANPSKLRHRSAGMTITQKRLEILHNSDYRVEITETKNEHGKSTGTRISILI